MPMMLPLSLVESAGACPKEIPVTQRFSKGTTMSLRKGKRRYTRLVVGMAAFYERPELCGYCTRVRTRLRDWAQASAQRVSNLARQGTFRCGGRCWGSRARL